jgi:O-acetyl-ADP-ribose deacetylase (regulator of RNase III)
MKTIDCNLLDAEADVIAHCCNCFHTMGSGVALAIKDEYPEAYEADLKTPKGDPKKLGTVSLAVVTDPTTHKNQNIKAICNIYGQFNYGGTRHYYNRPPAAGLNNGVERHVDYEAIACGLAELRRRLKSNVKTIAFPYKMGADRAGGDWRIIEKIIEVTFENSGFEILICRYTPPSI